MGAARWLADCDLHYWGDLDTHGFAMLDRLRSVFPKCRSLLMDRATLLAHAAMWTIEAAPRVGALDRSVRLEQERIGFDWVRRAIATAVDPDCAS